MQAKVAISFLKSASDAELLVAASHILDTLRSNPDFRAPIPWLDDATAALQAFRSAVQAKDGSALGYTRRNERRHELAALLRMLAFWVQHASGGDMHVLLGSGFEIHRRRRPAELPAAPAMRPLRRPDMSGQLKARCEPVPGARAYRWRYATAQAPGEWIEAGVSTSTRLLLTGLVPGTVYLVQVRAAGSKGEGDWSQTVRAMAV